jgi:DNA polymerase-3 subunit epsilon
VSPSVPLSPASVRIHGLLPWELASAPPVERARDELGAALDTRILLAWFAELEVAFLSRIFATGEREWWRRTVDVRRLVLALEREPADSRLSLTAAAGRFGVPVRRARRRDGHGAAVPRRRGAPRARRARPRRGPRRPDARRARRTAT